MPVQDLDSPDDYDLEPVDHNPFGAMAQSPNDYHVEPVSHDPFATPTPQPSGIGSDARYPQAPPLGWNPPPLSASDRDLLIKTVYGEARGEPEAGQAGVTNAILNRVRSGGYGQGIEGVVKAPAAGVNPRLGYHEFSPWNTGRATEGQPAINTLPRDRPADYARIGALVDKVYSGTGGDPTFGATHYYGLMRRPPPWAGPLAAQNQVKIGNTTFVGGEQGPGYDSRLALGYQSGGAVDPSRENIPAEPGYFYHATNTENAQDIAESGKLDVHPPEYGTEDQFSWPDGSTEPRSYWTHDPQIARAFYPAEGEPTLLRAPANAAPFQRERTGDFYLNEPIAHDKLERYHGAGVWGPMTPPQVVGHPAVGLVGEEERLLREREGLEPPGQTRPTESAGGRIPRHIAFLMRPR